MLCTIRHSFIVHIFSVNKVNLNPSKRKLTVTDARKTTQLKKQQLEKNLQKLKEVKKLCTINLDQKVTQQVNLYYSQKIINLIIILL